MVQKQYRSVCILYCMNTTWYKLGIDSRVWIGLFMQAWSWDASQKTKSFQVTKAGLRIWVDQLYCDLVPACFITVADEWNGNQMD